MRTWRSRKFETFKKDLEGIYEILETSNLLFMSKQNKKNKDESLLEMFLSTSDAIDNDIEKAKEIIKEEGLDPEELKLEGMAFIKNLQKRNEAESKIPTDLELNELIKRL